MASKKIKGFCTKYALTAGIIPCSGVVSGSYVYARLMAAPYVTPLKKDVDFFTQESDAEAAALTMAERKVKSLKAQLKKAEPFTRTAKWATRL